MFAEKLYLITNRKGTLQIPKQYLSEAHAQVFIKLLLLYTVSSCLVNSDSLSAKDKLVANIQMDGFTIDYY